MFEVIEDQDLIEDIEDSERTRGAYPAFLTNIQAFYDQWIKKNPGGKFKVFLNGKDNAPFKGVKTDSLYQSLNSYLKEGGKFHEMKQAGWRLQKFGPEGTEDKDLLICKD